MRYQIYQDDSSDGRRGVPNIVVAQLPDIGASSLECLQLPMFAAHIEDNVNFPVFDQIGFIGMIYSFVVERRYMGIL